MSTAMADPGTGPTSAGTPSSKSTGSQTLDRGIRALVMVAASSGGLSVEEVADRLEVHRTIEHRLLATLAEHHLISRGQDNRFRDGGEVVAIAVATPTKAAYHLAFRTGSRHPLGRGSAGIALLSALPARPDERPEVTRARTQGFSVSKGEVEPGAHGLAVLIHQGGDVPGACLNLITYRDDVMARAVPVMLDGASRISALLS